MPLRKHESTVVLEILAAFGIVALLAIAWTLSLIASEIKDSNKAPAPVAVESSELIGVDQLDPAFLQAVASGFEQTQFSIGRSNQEIGFFMNKILQENFSEEEISALRTEYDALVQAQIEAAQAAAAQGQDPQAAEPQAPVAE